MEATGVKKTWHTQIWTYKHVKKEDAVATCPPPRLGSKSLPPRNLDIQLFFDEGFN